MAWDNENRENPWKRKDAPPDPEEILRRLKGLFNDSSISLSVIVIAAALVLALFSSFYIIEPGEVGVIQRFGRFVVMVENGPHLKIPFGVDRVTKVKREQVLEEEFGLASAPVASRGQFVPPVDTVNESLMLTGDLNCAIVPWIVQYPAWIPISICLRCAMRAKPCATYLRLSCAAWSATAALMR